MNEAEPYDTSPNAIMLEPTATAMYCGVEPVGHGRGSPNLAGRPLPQLLSALGVDRGKQPSIFSEQDGPRSQMPDPLSGRTRQRVSVP
jgi:hypothetical protein